MSVLETEDEWTRRQELQNYLYAWPLERFWINYWRKRRGAPPLRAKEASVELADIRRRLDARQAEFP